MTIVENRSVVAFTTLSTILTTFPSKGVKKEVKIDPKITLFDESLISTYPMILK